MEQLNQIHLRGTVGLVRMQEYEGRRVAHISLATTYAYKGKEGEGVIETTWHNISAWEGRNMCDFDLLQKGCRLEVIGRLKNQKYTGNDGIERIGYEVVAKGMAIIDNDTTFAYES
ncbi:MAG: single-stranded DNA-binding protein [Bacteroidales bacterium]|nr:single-stranded DNA-binding protein [Bacteroidales bacterium]